MTAEELFAESATATELPLEERSRETRDGAIVRDVRLPGATGEPVAAYVVQPATGSPSAGVLFLHWLGEVDSNRREFLDEAVDLAGRGVESVLIDQRFPWRVRPNGLAHDRVALGYQVRDARRAFAILAADVGCGQLGVVGHDFGAMYAALLRGVEPRVAAVVMLAPTGAWADWFVTYMRTVPSAEEAAYRAAMADLDPLTWLPRLGAPVFFQFASFDPFVPKTAADALVEAAPKVVEPRTYEAGHSLDSDLARSERTAWLLDRLASRCG